MLIKEMPFYNRPSYKLIEKGSTYLDDAELLAIIINSGNKKENAIDLSNRLLKKHNLHGLGRLSYNELKKEFNGDKIKPIKIMSLIELSKRYGKLTKGGYNSKPISSAKDVYDMLVDEMKDYKQEVFKIILLDTKNKPISVKDISIGTLNSTLVHPREVFKEAIKESANAIILVHNHPTADPTPSENDLEITKRLAKSGDILGIKILDHVIISKNGYDNILINYT